MAARRDRRRHRQRGHALLRSDAREGHRARRDARRGAGPAGRGAGPLPPVGRRDQPRLPDRGARRFPTFVAGDVYTGLLGVRRLPARCHRGARRGHADHGAGLAGAPRLLGRRRAAVGADGRAVVPARQSVGRQPRRGGRRSSARWSDRRCAFTRRPSWRSPAPTWTPRSTVRPMERFRRGRGPGRCVASHGPRARSGQPRHLAIRGGLDVPAYLGSRATFTLGLFGGHGGRALQPGDVLRPGDPPATAPAATPLPPALIPAVDRSLGDRRPARARTARPTSSADEDIADPLRHRLARSLQLQPHGRAPHRAQAALGAHRRRRGGPAPVEHSRQRLRDRHHRLHRRHADHPRPRRPEPGRLRLSGHDHRRRALEDGPAQGRATSSASCRSRWTRRATGRACRRGRSKRSARRRHRRRNARRPTRLARRDPVERRRPRRPAGRGDPPGRRRQPADRVRTAGARPRAALPRPRAAGGAGRGDRRARRASSI